MICHRDSIDDENGELGLGGILVEFAVHAIVHAGAAGCWRDADGHGCPTLPPEVVVCRVDVLDVIGEHGRLAVDAATRQRIAVWIECHPDLELIEGRILEESFDG